MMFALISLILVAFVSGQPRNIRHHGRDGPAAWVKARQPPQQNNVIQNVQSYVDSSGIEDFDSEYSKPNTIDLSCHHGGHPVCCSIADDNPDSSPAMSPYYPRQAPTPLTKEGFCTVQKEYIPSKYEEIHFAKVKEVNGKFHDERRRREEYTDFIFDDIPHAIKWMNRVQYHMKLREIPGSRSEQDIADDEYYLSKFKVTRTCQQSSSSSATSEVFYEYIEPLTIYGRHPYGIIACAKDLFKRIGDEIHYKGKSVTIPFKVSKQSRDYVLLANVNYPYYNSSFYQVNEEGSTVTKLKPRKRFLFDAGSKTFDSSLFWFVCGYLQRGIDFDSIYAWELHNFTPSEYWSKVPKKLLPYIHFYNEAVQPGPNDFQSVVRIIQQIATPDDFVSFKLDIDTPRIEIPIAMRLLKDQKFASLIDEFFFELHFRCEFMQDCGWGRGIPFNIGDLSLDHYSAISFFQDIRKNGVRAHFWP